MRINLEKLLELVPNTEEVCTTYLSEESVYYKLAERYNTQDRIRYIDILAALLGGIGVTGIECEYVIEQQNYTGRYYIELTPNEITHDQFSFKLTDYFEVEIGGYSYSIENVVSAYKFMQEFNLIKL